MSKKNRAKMTTATSKPNEDQGGDAPNPVDTILALLQREPLQADPIILRVTVPETWRSAGFVGTSQFTAEQFAFRVMPHLQALAVTKRSGDKKTYAYPLASCCIELATEREWLE